MPSISEYDKSIVKNVYSIALMLPLFLALSAADEAVVLPDQQTLLTGLSSMGVDYFLEKTGAHNETSWLGQLAGSSKNLKGVNLAIELALHDSGSNRVMIAPSAPLVLDYFKQFYKYGNSTVKTMQDAGASTDHFQAMAQLIQHVKSQKNQ